MELNINSPAYYSKEYGINDRVYSFCRECSAYFKEKEYSENMKIVGILPVAAPVQFYEDGLWKEKVSILDNGAVASISVRMDFEAYHFADDAGKVALMKDAILKAVKKIKTKGKFDYEAFKRDLDEAEKIIDHNHRG